MKRKPLGRTALLLLFATHVLVLVGCGTSGEELLPSRSDTTLFINELLADNESGAVDPDFGGRSDWIEMYNPGADAVDLEGFSLADDPADDSPWLFPAGASIAPGGFLIAWADGRDTVAAAYHADFKLNAGGEAVLLRDHADRIVDRVDFGEQAADRSWGRAHDGGREWIVFDVPTPGASNTGDGNAAPSILSVRLRPAAPGSRDTVRVAARIAAAGPAEARLVWSPGGGWIENAMIPSGVDSFTASIPPFGEGTAISYWVSVVDTSGREARSPVHAPAGFYVYFIGAASAPLFVNEFLAGNSANAADPDFNEFGDWIELYNAGNGAVDLDGWFLSDDPREPLRWTFPENVVVEGGGFLLVWADGRDTVAAALHTSFRIDKDGGETILLTDRFGTTIDSVPVGPQTTGVSFGRITDGGASWTFFSEPTPGAPNALAGGNEAPFFSAVLLDPDPPVAGEASEVRAVIRDTDGVDSASVFYDAGAGWRETPLAPAGGDSFAALLPPFPGGTPVAWYLYAADPLGAAAVDPPAGPIAPRRFTVPGSAPAVRINEFLAANSSGAVDPDFGETGDWIELFNAEDSTIYLSGWTLSDDAEATAEERWAFPEGASIEAGGHMLVWADGRDVAGEAFHTDFKLGVGGESILLFDASGDRADGIIFGPQRIDVSYGRTPDGAPDWTFFNDPSPGAPNR